MRAFSVPYARGQSATQHRHFLSTRIAFLRILRFFVGGFSSDSSFEGFSSCCSLEGCCEGEETISNEVEDEDKDNEELGKEVRFVEKTSEEVVVWPDIQKKCSLEKKKTKIYNHSKNTIYQRADHQKNGLFVPKMNTTPHTPEKQSTILYCLKV